MANLNWRASKMNKKEPMKQRIEEEYFLSEVPNIEIVFVLRV